MQLAGCERSATSGGITFAHDICTCISMTCVYQPQKGGLAKRCDQWGVIAPFPSAYAANRLFCGTLADSGKTMGIGLDAKYSWWTSFQTPLNLITRKSKINVSPPT